MGSIYDNDQFPPVWGPQAPLVAPVLERLRGLHGTETRPFFGGLLEAVEEFLHACRVLDGAELAHGQRSADFDSMTYESSRDSSSQFRAALFGYLNAGYAVLDAVAVYDLSNSPSEPWKRWAGQLESASANPVLRMLARVLTIRLREPRHSIAVHRRGWTVPALLVGGGLASLSRRPVTTPDPTPDLVTGVAAAFKTFGIELHDAEAMMPMAAEAFGPRAAQCTPSLRVLHSRLVDRYGVQTAPVAAITPSLLALVEAIALVPADQSVADRTL
jgi:hypothetical protein